MLGCEAKINMAAFCVMKSGCPLRFVISNRALSGSDKDNIHLWKKSSKTFYGVDWRPFALSWKTLLNLLKEDRKFGETHRQLKAWKSRQVRAFYIVITEKVQPHVHFLAARRLNWMIKLRLVEQVHILYQRKEGTKNLTLLLALMTLTYFTLSNARRFYPSIGNPLAVKELKAPRTWGIQTPEANDKTTQIGNVRLGLVAIDICCENCPFNKRN